MTELVFFAPIVARQFYLSKQPYCGRGEGTHLWSAGKTVDGSHIWESRKLNFRRTWGTAYSSVTYSRRRWFLTTYEGSRMELVTRQMGTSVMPFQGAPQRKSFPSASEDHRSAMVGTWAYFSLALSSDPEVTHKESKVIHAGSCRRIRNCQFLPCFRKFS